MRKVVAQNRVEHAIANTAPNLRSQLPSILAVLAFLSLNLLLVGNMGSANEVDILPLAKQFADPSWMPGDWYLNQPPSYRLVFQSLFGWLAAQWGFLATSIVGRLFCYSLVASGLVLIARRLNLSLPLLLLAVSLFVARQGVAAGEWFVTALEAKSVAYGFILLAINFMLSGRYVWMALLLGIATSFHVLVGGWAFLTALGWLALRPKTRLQGIRRFGLILLCYLAESVCALQAIAQQLFSPTPANSISTSSIYAFLRLPHHLDPFAWSPNAWIAIAFYLLVFTLSIVLLKRKRSASYTAQMGLAEFTLISLVPFVLGLAIAPFDPEGSLLQYYPFRFGDVMLPLGTALLFTCAVEQSFTGKMRRLMMIGSAIILGTIVTIQTVEFKNQWLDLHQFPNVQQEITAEWKNLCNWVGQNTAKDAVVMVSPDEWFATFTWIAERPTIVNFKLLPQTKAGIIEWYHRLDDLSGHSVLESAILRKHSIKSWELNQMLNTAYKHLTLSQVEALMTKYHAAHLVTEVSQQLDLPVAYRNKDYVVYTKRQA